MSSGDELRTKIEELRREAYYLPHGQTKFELLEEAVNLADTLNDQALGFDVRLAVTEAASFSGNRDRMLVHFAWCLALSDRYPQKYPISALLWRYKWVLTSAVDFPGVPLDRLEGLMEDFERRMAAQGASPRTAMYLRVTLDKDLGRRDQVAAGLEGWQRHPRDRWSDCAACERNRLVTFFQFLGQEDKALESALPLLAEQMSCAEVPHTTTGKVLAIHFHRRQYAEGIRLHLKWYPRLRNNRDFMGTIGKHIAFLAMTGNTVRALNALQRHYPWVLESHEDGARAVFYGGGAVLGHCLRRRGAKQVAFHLPPEDTRRADSGRLPVEDFIHLFETEARQLYQAFDRRNGNSTAIGNFEALLADTAHAVDFPVTTVTNVAKRSNDQ